jgi:hypothetical protein
LLGPLETSISRRSSRPLAAFQAKDSQRGVRDGSSERTV